MGGCVDEEEGVAKKKQGDTVTMDDIEMNFIEVFSEFCDRFTFWKLWNGGEITKSWRLLTPLEKTSVIGCIDDIFWVAKISASEQTMNFQVGKGAVSVRETHYIASTDKGGLGFIRVKQSEEVCGENRFQRRRFRFLLWCCRRR